MEKEALALKKQQDDELAKSKEELDNVNFANLNGMLKDYQPETEVAIKQKNDLLSGDFVNDTIQKKRVEGTKLGLTEAEIRKNTIAAMRDEAAKGTEAYQKALSEDYNSVKNYFTQTELAQAKSKAEIEKNNIDMAAVYGAKSLSEFSAKNKNQQKLKDELMADADLTKAYNDALLLQVENRWTSQETLEYFENISSGLTSRSDSYDYQKQFFNNKQRYSDALVKSQSENTLAEAKTLQKQQDIGLVSKFLNVDNSFELLNDISNTGMSKENILLAIQADLIDKNANGKPVNPGLMDFLVSDRADGSLGWGRTGAIQSLLLKNESIQAKLNAPDDVIDYRLKQESENLVKAMSIDGNTSADDLHNVTSDLLGKKLITEAQARSGYEAKKEQISYSLKANNADKTISENPDLASEVYDYFNFTNDEKQKHITDTSTTDFKSFQGNFQNPDYSPESVLNFLSTNSSDRTLNLIKQTGIVPDFISNSLNVKGKLSDKDSFISSYSMYSQLINVRNSDGSYKLSPIDIEGIAGSESTKYYENMDTLLSIGTPKDEAYQIVSEIGNADLSMKLEAGERKKVDLASKSIVDDLSDNGLFSFDTDISNTKYINSVFTDTIAVNRHLMPNANLDRVIEISKEQVQKKLIRFDDMVIFPRTTLSPDVIEGKLSLYLDDYKEDFINKNNLSEYDVVSFTQDLQTKKDNSLAVLINGIPSANRTYLFGNSNGNIPSFQEFAEKQYADDSKKLEEEEDAKFDRLSEYGKLSTYNYENFNFTAKTLNSEKSKVDRNISEIDTIELINHLSKSDLYTPLKTKGNKSDGDVKSNVKRVRQSLSTKHSQFKDLSIQEQNKIIFGVLQNDTSELDKLIKG